jgi:CBS domain-containing protein
MNRDVEAVTSASGSDDPPVTDVMTTHLVGITPDSEVSTALNLMARTGLRHLLVMNGQKCLGMLVEVDLVRCMAQGGALAAFTPGWSYAVGQITRPVEAMPITARRSDAARRMANGAEAVLVTCGDRLLGIVTTSDLIRSLAAMPRTNASNHSAALAPC